MKKTTQTKPTIAIRLNQSLMDYIRNEADRQGISMNALISILLTEAANGRKERT